MEYIVSARKYRPDTFSSVEGQDNIIATLKNAIKNNTLAHAYLFSGTRGVGKTTSARIFAKTINCMNITADYEPCNECESCKAFNENRSYNIHELDAASNNSVDDIRLLTEKVRIPPQMGNYSVYIIDEVHMLSSAAFNAFLKTLEEPPKHAIFILATTEKHKILPTILSRCQSFDFERISVDTATKRLRYVAEKEGVTIEEEALNIIATKADGAMRDALTIFDQIVASSGGNITYEQVIKNLNVLDYDYYFKLVEAFLEENSTDALLIFNDILQKGFEGSHFIGGLSNHFRDLMMCKNPQTAELLEVGVNIRNRYVEQAAKCEVDFIYTALSITNECDLQYRIARNKRLHVEFALLKLSRILTEKKKAIELAKRKEDAKANQKDTAPTVINRPQVESKKVENKPSVTSISIKGLMNKPQESQNKPIEEKKVEEVVIVDKTVTNSELLEQWQKYADNIKDYKPRLSSLLYFSTPTISGEAITYKVESSIQKNEMDRNREELLIFLKENLLNNSLLLETIVEENSSTIEIQPYTASEKFAAMIEKNPALLELQRRLNLELR